MKVHLVIEIEAKATKTQGSSAYLVATKIGCTMECPTVSHENYQIIRANSKEEAVQKYNKLNECNYFYGEVIDNWCF